MERQDGNRIKIFQHKHISYPGNKLEDIGRATGADKAFVADVDRMYLTHQNISVQGILDRIEIKGK